MITKQLVADVEKILKSAFQKPEIITSLAESLAATIEKLINEKLEGIKDEYRTNNNILNEKYEKLGQKYDMLNKNYSEKINDLEQQNKRSNLRIFGIPETKSEKTDEKIIQICKNSLNIELTSEDFHRCHRVGKIKTNKQYVNKNKHRAILIQLSGTFTRKKNYYKVQMLPLKKT